VGGRPEWLAVVRRGRHRDGVQAGDKLPLSLVDIVPVVTLLRRVDLAVLIGAALAAKAQGGRGGGTGGSRRCWDGRWRRCRVASPLRCSHRVTLGYMVAAAGADGTAQDIEVQHVPSARVAGG
jgi:hypothetical protein